MRALGESNPVVGETSTPLHNVCYIVKGLFTIFKQLGTHVRYYTVRYIMIHMF